MNSASSLGPYNASTHLSQGGVNHYRQSLFLSGHLYKIVSREGDLFCHGRSGFVGWMGFGGSCFQWNPRLKIGFAFIPTELEMDLTNMRAGMLQEAVVRVVARESNGSTSTSTATQPWWPFE